MSEHVEEIEALLHEVRRFSPSPDFVAQANATESIYAIADADPEAFWAEQARGLTWEHPYSTTLNWSPPNATWFDDGLLNASVNCLDRHVAAGLGDRVAYYWVGEPEGDQRTITYALGNGEPSRKCPHGTRRQGWRSRGDLPSNDS